MNKEYWLRLGRDRGDGTVAGESPILCIGLIIALVVIVWHVASGFAEYLKLHGVL